MWEKVMVGTVLAGVLTAGPMAQADMFDSARKATRVDISKRDATGVSIRGGVNLQTGQTPSSVTLLRGQANTGGGCSAFDFATSLKESFEEVPELIEGIFGNAIAGLPMLVLCYSSPSACDLVKFWSALHNVLVQAKTAQCGQVQAAMAYAGSRLRGGAQSQCLESAVNEGMGINKAMRVCGNDVGLLRAPDGTRKEKVDLVQETMASAGASTEAQLLVKNLLGEVTLQAQGRGLGSTHSRPQAALLARYEGHRAEADTAIRAAVEEYKATGTLSEATLRSISIPGQNVPLSAIQALATLQQDQTRYETFLGKLNTGAAIIRLQWDCDEVAAQLAAAADANSELTDEQRRQLERRVEGLRRELAATMEKVDIADRYLQPSLQTLMNEYVAIQQAASQAGLRAPTQQRPAMPYRTQMPSGYGQ